MRQLLTRALPRRLLSAAIAKISARSSWWFTLAKGNLRLARAGTHGNDVASRDENLNGNTIAKGNMAMTSRLGVIKDGKGWGQI